MKLGKFIKKFSHNNIIRLVYKSNEGGYETVLPTWDSVSMDWEVNKQQGKYRHYINNEVLGLASIYVCGDSSNPEAINIIIEKLENQPSIEEIIENKKNYAEAV
jgi:hypothetical protein